MHHGPIGGASVLQQASVAILSSFFRGAHHFTRCNPRPCNSPSLAGCHNPTRSLARRQNMRHPGLLPAGQSFMHISEHDHLYS